MKFTLGLAKILPKNSTAYWCKYILVHIFTYNHYLASSINQQDALVCRSDSERAKDFMPKRLLQEMCSLMDGIVFD